MSLRSKATSLYFFSVIGLAAIILFLSSDAYVGLKIQQAVIFTLLTLIAEVLPITLPKGAEVTVGFATLMGAILVVGTKTAVWVALVAALLMEIKRSNKMPLYKSMFNVSVYVVMVGASGYVYEYFGGEPGRITLPVDLWPLSALVITYLIINVSLITTALSLLHEEPIIQIFTDNFKWALPNYISLATLGLLLAVIYLSIGSLGILLFVVPLLIARHSFKLYMNMREVYFDTIQALATAIEAKDPYTLGHSERVAKYCEILAEEMKLTSDISNTLNFAALLHDIGKIGISEEVLNKPGRLSPEEFEEIKNHSALGSSIVGKIDFLVDASHFIRYHHERLDGSGYPEGLKGDDIPLGAKILAVADTFDALTSDRPYRRAWSADKALEEIQINSGILFDAQVVKALNNAFNKGRIKIYVS